MWANQPTAVREGVFKEKLVWGEDAAGVGGKGTLATVPPPAKIGTVSETAWHFGPEDLVKITLIIKYCKKNMDRAF